MSSITQEKPQVKNHPVLPYLAVTLALATPVLQLALRPLWELFSFPINRFMSLSIFWIIAAAVLFYSVRIEGIPLATFGITKNSHSLRYRLIEMIAALLLGLLVAIVVIGFSSWIRQVLNAPTATSLKPENILPFWVTLPAWITAAFFEEVLFRSYPIERLSLLTGKRWLAALISGFCFVVLHLFAWDWLHILTVGVPATLIITGLYLWRRSLWFVVIIHAILDLPILLLPFIAPFLAN